MTTRSLFDDLAPPHDNPSGSARLRVVPGKTGATLSAAAKAYNQQIARVEKLKSQLAEMEAMAQAHRQALATRIFPLEQRQLSLMKDMALWLDSYLDPQRSRTKLTPKQRETARDILCNLSGALAAQGDADMAALHDRYSPVPLAEIERAQTQAMRAELEAVLGAPLMADHPDATLDELLGAAAAHLQRAAQAKENAREAAAAKRKAKKAAKGGQKPLTAAQLLQQELQTDADASLRGLYRQLASALHPDRETDPGLHAQKTALMSEVNAAYARKDLVTLMDIQQRAALADPDMLAGLPDDKLKALTLLVKAQVAELERTRAQTQHALMHEFKVPFHLRLTAGHLQLLLAEQEAELGDELAAMRADLELIQQEASFKRWLTQQRKLGQRQERLEAMFDPFDPSNPFDDF